MSETRHTDPSLTGPEPASATVPLARPVQIARCPEHGLHGERTECFVCSGPVEQVPMVPAFKPIRDDEMPDVGAARAEIAAWQEAGSTPWELPASVVHFVLACYGMEVNRGGTFDALLAVSDDCEECGGDGFFQDDSHPGNPSFTCETCTGFGRVPKRKGSTVV